MDPQLQSFYIDSFGARTNFLMFIIFSLGRMVKNKQSAAAVGRFCPIFCVCVMKQ